MSEPMQSMFFTARTGIRFDADDYVQVEDLPTFNLKKFMKKVDRIVDPKMRNLWTMGHRLNFVQREAANGDGAQDSDPPLFDELSNFTADEVQKRYALAMHKRYGSWPAASKEAGRTDKTLKGWTDPIDDIYGSTAKSAVVDAALGLYREQGKHGATLKVTGRDLEEREMALEWDGRFCRWQFMGDAGEVHANTFQAEILQAVRELGSLGEAAITTRIASHLGKDKGNVSRKIADLLASGQLEKGNRAGKQQPYVLPQQ